ncbi:hypothetical protein GN244_ATG06410 [Phytophthora infestans]|uniref:Uncharacterized protein n=1 Tax=Phytophthora infestans TaxID=4787 RepID=A0A833TIG3_PHYIN|nr:hypothetical protein GN244_ATG06410 [Phytophthora infestans]
MFTDLPSKYARFVCAMNLQKIKVLLCASWTFSIALDMSTHMSVSYLDTRIRLFHCGQIINLHLLAIPMYDSHTGEAMFNAIIPVLDVLCPDWKEVMLGVTTDGERKMTGSSKGMATRFQKVCSSGFMRVWCGLHQLDLVLQKAFKAARMGQFHSSMTSTIAYLRRQAKLIRTMNSTAPLLQDKRWESMLKCCTWFKSNRIKIATHLAMENPACKPPDKWWLCLTLIHLLSKRAVITFRSLESYTALVSEQVEALKRLSRDLLSVFGGRAVLDADRVNLVQLESNHVFSDDRTILVNPNTILDLLLDDGTFTIQILDSLGPDLAFELVKDFALVIANLVASVNIIEPERNNKNEALEGNTPPALPRDLIKLKGRDISALINLHRDRLHSRWSEVEIDMIEQEHAALTDLYASQAEFRRQIDEASSELKTVTAFEDAWKDVCGRFIDATSFCWRTCDYISCGKKKLSKSRLTNFSLEGALHSKQYDLLESLTGLEINE